MGFGFGSGLGLEHARGHGWVIPRGMQPSPVRAVWLVHGVRPLQPVRVRVRVRVRVGTRVSPTAG